MNVNIQDYLNPDLPNSQGVSGLLLQMNPDKKTGRMVIAERYPYLCGKADNRVAGNREKDTLHIDSMRITYD